MHRTDLATVLENSSLFAGLTPAELKLLAERSARRVFHAGEQMFSEGEPCSGLYTIVRGKVRIYKTSASGREQVLAVNSPGDSVAELPVFDGGPYPASALAVEDTEIAFISRRDLQAFCMEHPEVALKMLAAVGARLRTLVGIIEELSFTTIRQRLAAVLVKLARTEGKQTEQGIEFLLPATHQELAHQLGTVRELISRNLAQMKAEGLIDVEARLITVRNLNALSALLESGS